MTIKDIRPKEDLEELLKDIAEIGTGADTRQGNWRHRKKNGELIIVETTAHSIVYNNKKARMVVANDITKKIAAEKAIRESEEKYRTLVEQAFDAIIIYSPAGIILDSNQTACSYTGYTHKQLQGLHIMNLFFKEDLAAIPINLERIEAGQPTLDYRRIKKKDGSYLEMEISTKKMPDGNMMAIARDITVRKKAERELLQSQKRLEQAQAIAHLGNWEVNFETNQSKWSDEAYRLYGIVPGDHNLSMQEWMSFVHPEDLDQVQRTIGDSQKTLSNISFHHRIIRKDGAIRHIYSEARYEFNKEGKPIGLYGISHDVTESKEAEEEVRKINERFQYATKATSDIIWELNFETKEYLLHEGKEKLFAPGTIIDWKLGTEGKYIVEEDREKVRLSFYDARMDMNRVLWELEYRVYAKEGSVLFITNHAIFIRDKNGKVLRAIGALTVITDKKKLEADLLAQQRQEQIRVTATALEAQEKERHAIGIELHDNVNQILVATNLTLSLIKANPEKAHTLVASAMQNLQDVIQENRKIAHVFVAPNLITETLADQLTKLMDNMLGAAGVEAHIFTKGLQEELLTKEMKINIYRIAQEQCTNIVKYAKASKVNMTLRTEKGYFEMMISDNGVGMDSHKKVNGIGIRNIKGRLSVFNGTAKIITAPGKGFALEIMIPPVA
jgi:PAS domain S-box-containing protein